MTPRNNMKAKNRFWSFVRHGSLAFALSAFAAGLLTPGAARALVPTTTPSVKIGVAALITPTAASSFYGSSTTVTNSVGSYVPPNEIVELARALGNNVDTIYEFVRNNIEVAWMYGEQKGALGAITDRSGTPFDQAALMVALLRQAGYTAQFQTGTIEQEVAASGTTPGTSATWSRLYANVLAGSVFTPIIGTS